MEWIIGKGLEDTRLWRHGEWYKYRELSEVPTN